MKDSFFLLFNFEPETHSGAQAPLELVVSDSSLPSARKTGVSHHARLRRKEFLQIP